MSSWLVHKAHIDLLVEAVFRYELPTTTPYTPDALGAMLWHANYKGVNYRYGKRSKHPAYRHTAVRVLCGDANTRDGKGYARHTYGTVTTAVRNGLLLWQQIRCYAYQSCDHPGYHTSPAGRLMAALESAVLKSLGMDEDAAHAACTKDNMPWGVYDV